MELLKQRFEKHPGANKLEVHGRLIVKNQVLKLKPLDSEDQNLMRYQSILDNPC